VGYTKDNFMSNFDKATKKLENLSLKFEAWRKTKKCQTKTSRTLIRPLFPFAVAINSTLAATCASADRWKEPAYGQLQRLGCNFSTTNRKCDSSL
jgi:hypothetical protein